MKQIPWVQDVLNPSADQGPLNITIGVFDGLHRGHQFLIRSLRNDFQAPGGTGVITFEPNPGAIVQPDRFLGNLLTPALKKRCLAGMGVNRLFSIDFSLDFSRIGGEIFLNYLRESLWVKEIFLGEDFHLGKGRAFNLNAVKQWGAAHGIIVHGVPQVQDAGLAVSSTRIRTAIATGDMRKAVHLLGRAYPIDLTHGDFSLRGDEFVFRSRNDLYGQIMPPDGTYWFHWEEGDEPYSLVVKDGELFGKYRSPDNRILYIDQQA